MIATFFPLDIQYVKKNLNGTSLVFGTKTIPVGKFK